MWAYIQTEAHLWTVGFYSPDGLFHTDSDHNSKEEAAERVHWLNGGEKHPESLLEAWRKYWNEYAQSNPD